MLEDFYFTRLKFTVEPKDVIILPEYKGSTLRGGFGHAFKVATCVANKKSCKDCILTDNCLYNYVFNTPLSDDSAMMKKYPYAPHPFVIEPPEEKKREYHADDKIEFNLVLIGKVIDQLPYFIYAFEKLGELGLGKGRGEYKLQQVAFQTEDGEPEVIYQDGKLKKEDVKIHFSSLPSMGSERIRVKLRTPLRVKYHGSLVNQLEFHILFRNLLRRTSLLSFFHCDQEMDVDFKGLIESAKEIDVIDSNTKWYDWERYSGRKEEWIKMGGIIGEITFQGELEEFSPLLKLGEYTHVGKGTAFGLGRYEIK